MSAERTEAEALAAALDNARPFDFHRQASAPPFQELLASICSEFWPNPPSIIQQKHIEVMLLDLYVAWQEDPDLKLYVSMRPADYKAKSRYNALGISRTTIEIVRQLQNAGLIELKVGFYDKTKKVGKRTRIWPTAKLITLFKSSKISTFQIGRASNEEVIVLRDADKREIDYEDTKDTIRMRDIVKRYNNLLSRNFIDIRRLDNPWIELDGGNDCIPDTSDNW